MKYAVIRVLGRQLVVQEGEEILLESAFDSKKVDAEVLLYSDGEKVSVGTPTLAKPKVTLSLIGEEKGEKIHVRKYKAKSRYRKHIGSRAKFQRFSVSKFS